MRDRSAVSTDARMRPSVVCARLLAALCSAEGRRRSRKRDQTPDAIGLAIKRRLLEDAVRDDPQPEGFEAWLITYVTTLEPGWTTSAGSAMAQAVFEEWQLALHMSEFAHWLNENAPSDDVVGRHVASR